MPASAIALAVAAAFLHAFWNLVVARARDPEAATAVASIIALVAYAPVAAAAWRFETRAVPYVVATSFLHLCYMSLLGAAYRRAELSVVYPMSRGIAPVLVLVVGVAVLGAGTSVGQALGVCLVGAGILLVRGLGERADARGVFFGLVIGGFIAAYTLNDRYGVRYASPFAYLEIAMFVPTLAYAGVLTRLRGLAGLRAELRWASVAAGVATFGSYGLVLAALQRGPAASVAAIREISIVIAAGLAAVVLGEDVGALRLLGAVLVVGGVAFISVS